MHNDFACSAHWTGEFNETNLQQWAKSVRSRFKAPKVTLGLIFMAPKFHAHAQAILEILRVHAQIPLLVGCSSTSLIVEDQEIEDNPGIALGLYHFPNTQLRSYHFTQDNIEESNGPGYWHLETLVKPEQCNGWLAFADPFQMDAERWLAQWNEAYASCPIMGGLATGDSSEQRTQIYLNGEVYDSGAIAVAFLGDVAIMGIISQGCTPIGETWTITKVQKNLILQVANRRAYDVLVDTYQKLPPADQEKTRGNVMIGMVINEYLEDFHRGDFLIRGVIGADPRSGIIAVGAMPRPGQTMQFQRRDAAAATEDMLAILQRARKSLANKTIYGACLCNCTGRGIRLFSSSNHDAKLVQQFIEPPGMIGFFCNGEIGPIGNRNFLHGYTASLAVFVKR